MIEDSWRTKVRCGLLRGININNKPFSRRRSQNFWKAEPVSCLLLRSFDKTMMRRVWAKVESFLLILNLSTRILPENWAIRVRKGARCSETAFCHSRYATSNREVRGKKGSRRMEFRHLFSCFFLVSFQLHKLNRKVQTKSRWEKIENKPSGGK